MNRTPPRTDDDAEGLPAGFAYRVRKSGDVEVMHGSRQASVLRGDAAAAFLAKVSGCTELEAQQLMARITGNYKHGNERLATLHPRSGK